MPFDPTLSPLLAAVAGTAARIELANANDDDCGEPGCDCGSSCTCSAGECGCGG